VTVAEGLGFPGSQVGKVAPEASVVTDCDGVGMTLGLEGLAITPGLDETGARVGSVELGVAGVDMHPDNAMRMEIRIAVAADRGARVTCRASRGRYIQIASVPGV